MSGEVCDAVAVITTLYIGDRIDYFDLAMSSIEAQDIDRDVHIYLCCDGPLTSEQEAYLEKNAKRFFRIVRNDENRGLARSLNCLIDILGCEEFVFRMDGDDISKPSRFRKQVELMQDQCDLALIGCQAWDIDENGDISATRDYPVRREDILDSVMGVNPILHPTFCVRRDALRDSRIRYPEAFLSEDLAILILLIESGYAVGNHPDRLFYWRVTPDFFLRRQSLRRGLTELKWYLRAARAQGRLLSFRIILPFLRAALRVLPPRLVGPVYRSGIRNRFVQ